MSRRNRNSQFAFAMTIVLLFLMLVASKVSAGQGYHPTFERAWVGVGLSQMPSLRFVDPQFKVVCYTYGNELECVRYSK